MNVFRALAACAVCLMSLAHPAPLAAQAPGEPAEGNVSIYNLDSQSRTAGLAIDGSIDKAVASSALELIRFLRPDHDEVTVYLNSPGGDASAAIEIGQEIKRLSILTAMDEHAECLGACVLILAAGAARCRTRWGSTAWPKRTPRWQNECRPTSPAWACRTGCSRR